MICPKCNSNEIELNGKGCSNIGVYDSYCCKKCGKFWIEWREKPIINDLELKIPLTPEQAGNIMGMPQKEPIYGWICPKCGVGVNPNEKTCPKCNNA